MKIQYIGTYRDGGSGYGKAATEFILALHMAGANVKCRRSSLGENKPVLHPILNELEKNDFGTPDFTIHHVPPYLFEYSKEGGINIGHFYLETSPCPYQWAQSATMMDGVMLSCNNDMSNLMRSVGFTPKHKKAIFTCGLPCDTSVYMKSYAVPEVFETFANSGRYLFYTIGELDKRKNLSGLLRAYFSEFNRYENVGLVIKTGMSGQTPQQVSKMVEVICNDILGNGGCKLNFGPPVYIVSDRLTENDMMALHEVCDCFVQPSHGESWSIPAFDAMAFGKHPIVSNCGGYPEYIKNGVGELIDGFNNHVFASSNVHAELFTAKSDWFYPNLANFQLAMRNAYTNKPNCFERGLENALKFDRLVIGKQLLDKLSAV